MTQSLDDQVTEIEVVYNGNNNDDIERPNAFVLQEFKDKYIGVEGNKLSTDLKLEEVSPIQIEYFKSYLRQLSINNAVNGVAPLEEAYTEFYRDVQKIDNKSKKSEFSFFSKALPLTDEDNLFFKNLQKVKEYVLGEKTENILQALCDIAVYDIQSKKMPLTNETANQARYDLFTRVKDSKIKYAVGALENKLQNEPGFRGSMYSIPLINNLVDAYLVIEQDFSMNLTDESKQKIYEQISDYFEPIFDNERLSTSEKEKATDALTAINKLLYVPPSPNIEYDTFHTTLA
ncbi:MAG: hypothetical protein ACP5N3_03825 [Candidatus Nanoarchaeia archaeon]